MEVSKNQNYTDIFNYIYSRPGVTKHNMGRDLELSLPTINRWLSEMQANNLVYASGLQEGTGGRRATIYSINSHYKAAVGIEVEPDSITAVVMDFTGNLVTIGKYQFPFERSNQYYQRVGDIVNHIIKKSNIPQENFLGVGIGIPGLVSKDYSQALHSKILDFTGWNIHDFENYIPLPCRLFNDAKSSAFAEIWAQKDLSTAVYVMLGKHVGGALILNGEVDLGENTTAGEVGHITIIHDGQLCYCGQKGCADSYCTESLLTAHSGGDIELFFEFLRNGDPACVEAWRQYTYHLALALHNVDILLNCPIILGGSVGALCDDYISGLGKSVAALNPFADSSALIRPCLFKKEAISAGAALSFIDEFKKTI